MKTKAKVFLSKSIWLSLWEIGGCLLKLGFRLNIGQFLPFPFNFGFSQASSACFFSQKVISPDYDKLNLPLLSLTCMFLTCENGEPPHGREWMIPRCIQDVQLIYVASNIVNFAVEILNGGCVLVIKAAIEKPRDNGTLAHPGGSQYNHPVGILGWHIQGAVPTGHSLHHCSDLKRCKKKEQLLPKIAKIMLFLL